MSRGCSGRACMFSSGLTAGPSAPRAHHSRPPRGGHRRVSLTMTDHDLLTHSSRWASFSLAGPARPVAAVVRVPGRPVLRLLRGLGGARDGQVPLSVPDRRGRPLRLHPRRAARARHRREDLAERHARVGLPHLGTGVRAAPPALPARPLRPGRLPGRRLLDGRWLRPRLLLRDGGVRATARGGVGLVLVLGVARLRGYLVGGPDDGHLSARRTSRGKPPRWSRRGRPGRHRLSDDHLGRHDGTGHGHGPDVRAGPARGPRLRRHASPGGVVPAGRGDRGPDEAHGLRGGRRRPDLPRPAAAVGSPRARATTAR